MIRNENEYQEASARLAEERGRLAEHRARLKEATRKSSASSIQWNLSTFS
jgi:hypothetical protein